MGAVSFQKRVEQIDFPDAFVQQTDALIGLALIEAKGPQSIIFNLEDFSPGLEDLVFLFDHALFVVG